MSGIFALAAIATLIGIAILIGFAFLGVSVLRRAGRAVREGGQHTLTASTRERRVSTGLAFIAALLAVSPVAAVIIGRLTVGPNAVGDDLERLAIVALALGAISIPAAHRLGYRAARSAVGGLLVVVLVLPAAIQLWFASATVASVTRYQAMQEEAAVRVARYADVIDGPSAGEIVAAVGEVGSWRAVAGGGYPPRVDLWRGDQGPIIELAGRTARFAFFVQCWIEGDPGVIEARVHDLGLGFGQDEPWIGRSGTCDGAMQVVVSEPVTLAAWPTSAVQETRAKERILVALSAEPLLQAGKRSAGEFAFRYVVFVSADPAAPLDELAEAVRAAAGTFEIR